MNHSPFFFDVLPIHPQPKPLESFTSYLMRLGEANRIRYPCDLGHRLFPNQNPYSIRIMTDHVPVTFGVVPQQACCSETKLLTTTFHHLGRKFGRATKGKALSSFLHDSIALSLRYCPLCLQESPYYRLPWRFLALTGCYHHSCHLLDRCRTCNQPIRLLHNTIHVGICPSCQTPLSTMVASPLSAHEQMQCEQIEQDLTYLLSPQSWETGDFHASTTIGHLLEQLRWQKGVEPSDLFQQTGLSSTAIRHLELGKGRRAGVSFQRYLRYATFMGVSLRQLFCNELDAFAPLPDNQPTREMEMTTILQTAIEQLQANQQPINHTTLRQTTGFSKDAFRHYPTTKKMLANIREQAEQQRKEDFLAQVKHTVQHLRNEGKIISLTNIGRTLKKRPHNLKSRPLVWNYLQQLIPPLETHPQQGKSTLSNRVQKRIQFSTDNEQSSIHQNIADHLAMASPHLYQQPQAKQLLQQRTAAKREQEQKCMLEQVQSALSYLHANDLPITKKAIIALTNTSYRRLSKYPRIDVLITHHLKAYKQHQKEERMNQIRQAIQYLKENKLPVTKKAICRQAKIGETIPYYQPELMPILESALAEEKQLREQHLLEQVEVAIQYLLTHSQSVTLPSIGQIVGASASRLFMRPQINNLLRQAKAEMRQQFENDLIQHINEAVQVLKTTNLPLTQNNICAKIGMPRTKLKQYQRAKTFVDSIVIPYHQAQGTVWGTRHHQKN